MLRAKPAALVAVVATLVCCVFPRSARAQSGIVVETLPKSDGTMPRTPFDMAAPDMQAASRLVGCYDVTLGPWSTPEESGGGIPMPARLDLLSEPHTRIYIGFRLVARTPGFPGEREGYPPAWGPIGADSLQVRAWADGSRSVAIFLRRHGDGELRGTARYFSDANVVDGTGRWMWETYPTATVSLRPRQCGSP